VRTRRLATAAAVTLVLVAGAGQAQRARAPWELDGSDWKAMSEGQKMAFLGGVIAGAAFARVLADSPAADAEVAALVTELRRAGGLPFQYAPNVYKARVEDFYFYTDRLPTPIVKTLSLIERELRGNGAPPR
jgi:hypothetical protein